MLDGPAYVQVNIFVRSISKIDDVTMVSLKKKVNKQNNRIIVFLKPKVFIYIYINHRNIYMHTRLGVCNY